MNSETKVTRPYPLLSRFLAPPTSYDERELECVVRDKPLVLTGASFGIGEALAIRLGRVGARLHLVARSKERLTAVQRTVIDSGGKAECYSTDLRDTHDIDQTLEAILEKESHIHAVIHNAGKSIRRSLHDSLDRPHDFERCMAVNYLGPVRLQLGLFPRMLEKGGGQIVNVSSVSVRLPPAMYWAAYHSSKTAFDVWLRAAAPELAFSEIDCTSVYFGLVHTRMSAPTESYTKMPGLTADQAAGVVCRALIQRPRLVQPWWLGPAHLLSTPLAPLAHWTQTMMAKRKAKT